ncbi:MAG: tRNA (N6-isopentenyl adenosine(37)-C2)-methylthiotransferase MiaB [Coriobacteriales bacterium]|jgi:tRNA-2-methylthio-N6-dimethylallyladenosine synthase|nr:tRNA (N6-isopentenyl adenosine(37)-C2)-methylthiotransferase MiaB [Coriobacteriales bacterium]
MQLNGLNYHLRTFGCQMNLHDAERIAGMLEALGALPTDTAEQADIVVFMTCCVREAADQRLLGQVASLKNLPAPHHRRLIAVGGCIGQRDGAKLVELLPHIDVVFGTHNISSLPGLLTAALTGEGAQVEVPNEDEATGILPATALPAHREQPWHAWLPIMTGCDNHCSYCIVPKVRGREISRPFDEILHEVQALLTDGVVEITLLGQNVNSYGRDLYGKPRFAEILRAVGTSGVQRLRFTTSHPKDLSEDTIAAFAETAAVMPHLHLPFQSGSNRILSAMNRHYTAEQYHNLVRTVRQAAAAAGKGDQTLMGSVALSTDIIVGFPGEDESDFQATCELVREIGFAQAFTFIYSRRTGTPAAELIDNTPAEVIQNRFQQLVEIVQQSAWQQNQLELASTTTVLFEGNSKRDATMLSGRSPKNTTVHAPMPTGKTLDDFIGRILPVRIETARTWYLRGELV